MAINAINKNNEENSKYFCEHTCIEPYEMPWLEKTNVKVIRKRVEEIKCDFFESLNENDILFIDSSHMIRPQGDVLKEYLEILPVLKKGVLIHIHDIFSPYEYPEEWILKEVRFWNEQYLLEAFLSFNEEFKIIGALNLLKHKHFGVLAQRFPILKKEREAEPGSFWLVRN
jgi:hypothetical protein